jgi:glyoxylase-like metal-dependent hydrolase (beta-lactamase superfamily II)
MKLIIASRLIVGLAIYPLAGVRVPSGSRQAPRRRYDMSMLQTNVADGVHRIEDAHTNWYLVEDDRRLTVVDTGVPRSWESLHTALAELGRKPADIAAVVLTHAHFDHLGFAERARVALNVPVYVHENDVPLTRHPRQYAHERARTAYLATQPRALPYVLGFARTRALFPAPVGAVTRYAGGSLPVPGSPRVVLTPGHTLGHCALHLPDRDVVIAGDAVVTLDPYTGRTGPRIIARAATADSERNLATLQALAETNASTVLVGHGEPWTGGARAIVDQARAAGVA